ncbi:hypothetical protein [Plantactinospora veratri]
MLAAILVGLLSAFPAVAATTCPSCYGLELIADDLYAERGLRGTQQQQVIDVVDDGRRRVREFYGGTTGSPTVLACLSSTCYDRIGGGRERGIAVMNRAVMLSPRGVDVVIAAHELSHVEFGRRMDEHAEQVPQWFDEGLAVLVSDDPRYLLPQSAGDRCRVPTVGPLPTTLDEWLAAARADTQLYARAACQVNRWADATAGGRAYGTRSSASVVASPSRPSSRFDRRRVAAAGRSQRRW